MNNEIGRKLTSLTLLSILLASGVTFAVPGVMPVAEAAHNANLFVSAENSQFNNYFAGPQVVEVVVNDPNIDDLQDAQGEPDVTVNGKKLRMAQATDGNWYGYFASRVQAQTADATIQAGGAGTGLDFGIFCSKTSGPATIGISLSETVGFSLADNGATGGSQGTDALAACTAFAGSGNRTNNVVRENKTLNTASPTGVGQLGIVDRNVWPFVQLYDFSVGGNVIIKYNKGGGVQTTTLTFDTIPSNLISTSFDRSSYPQNAEVHLTLTDPQLDIDPTDEDSWTWGVSSGNNTLFYQAFDENGDAAAIATPTALSNLAGSLAALMFEKNGRLTVNLAAQGAAVAELGDNDDQVFNSTTSAIINNMLTITELEPKSGVFGTYDENDNSNLDITETAPRGKSATIRYNDVSKSVVVGFGFASVDISVPDGNWGSGEEVPVTIVDSDANKNSRSDEDMDLNNPDVAIIPALKIGNPFTLNPGDDALFVSAVALTAGGEADSDRFAFASLTGVNQTATITFADKFSQRALITPDFNVTAGIAEGTTFGIPTGGGLLIELSDTMKSLNNVLAPTNAAGDAFTGVTMFNYDIRSLAQNTTITNVNIYLVATNGTGTDIFTDLSPTNSTVTGNLTAIQLASSSSLQGVFNLGQNSTGATVVNATQIARDLKKLASTDGIGLLFTLNGTGGGNVTLAVADVANKTRTMPIVADFFSFGILGDGISTLDRVNNAIYRLELEETGDNTSTFIGSLEYTMLNQVNIFDPATYASLRTIDDEVTFIAQEDLTDEDAPRVNYFDKGADGVDAQTSDQQEAVTHSGVVSFDRDTYKIADTVTVTLEDNDLNVDSDLIDIYVTVDPTTSGGDIADDTIGAAGLGTYTNGDAIGRLLDVTFDDERWLDGDLDTSTPADGADCAAIDASATDVVDDGLADTGFTLIETGADTGVFKGDFEIPTLYCSRNTGGALSTTGQDLEVNYVDFRDASGEIIEVGDGAGVRANTGSISLDRTVYPVPFGKLADFSATGTIAGTSPGAKSIFPVHLTGITATGTTSIATAETLPEGDMTIHVRVNDPDFDISPTGEDVVTGTTTLAGVPVGLVKVSVSRGADSVILAFAGAAAADPGVLDVITTGAPHIGGPAAIRELGPIVEIAPNAGIFELDLPILYTDGPASPKCPTTTFFTGSDADGGTLASDRFNDSIVGAQVTNHCILQGDIITVEYTDPTDASGDINTVTDSATFDLRNGVLQSDKSVYIIGADMIMTLIEPDLDLDSDTAESYDLDLIEWDSDADTLTMGNLGGQAGAFDPEPSDLRETGDSTGIFQIVIEIPATLSGERLDRGEEIQLEYTDWGPSGADFVGDEDEDINLTVYTSNFGATVELDQKVYTWTDKVFITIVAPDHNFDSNLVDEIGETNVDKITVATRGTKLPNYKLVETGTDTGIFTGEVILTGFDGFDADGDGTEGDALGTNGGTFPSGTGPVDGFLPADDDDGLTVSFEFTEDETVVGSALIRWNIGEVQFLEASYPATGQGVVRVVDPDMNLNPEAVDNFDVDVWSDSDAGGIDLTVTETNEATGIFEGTVFFTVTDESSGHRLRVAEGDTVTAEYEDNTLPSPYTTADELEITATTFIGTIVPPLERAPASNPRIVDAFGNELDEVNVDQQIQITADLVNGQDRDQPFAYLVQIQDENGVTVSLSWITGSLAPGQSLNPAQSWTPASPGTYNAQIFVWESVDNPDALSPPVSTEITVV